MPNAGTLINFERIFAALFTQLQTANAVLTAMGNQPGWTVPCQFNNITRVVQSWDQTQSQPALVMQQWAPFDVITVGPGIVKWKLRARAWIYVQVPGDSSAIAAQFINPLLQAVVQSLAPNIPGEKQQLVTAGVALCDHCWIEGSVFPVVPVPPDSQAVVMVPISIVTA